jgi:aldehyde dehydrogenase (NAD+)/coniferyl-aldehyde dehydrogenase
MDPGDLSGEAMALRRVFDAQQAAHARAPLPDRRDRDRRLAMLEALLHDHLDEIAAAIRDDFGHRSVHETRLLEGFPSVEAVRHARRHLARWMRPQRRATSLWFLPGRSEVRCQPLGVVGIIVPWNYPLYLAAGPLAGALAAGNRAMLKLSEFTPAFTALFARLVRERFAEDELAVIEGGADVAAAFSALPFDHLLFTGSTAVGRHVMRAASEHLTPVTLELGGKSPAIVAPSADLDRAAGRIAVGKLMNAGQTCIAPDYALVPRGDLEAFAKRVGWAVARCYPELASTPDYTAIASPRQFARLQGYLAEARAAGARLYNLGGFEPDPATRRFPPVLLLDPPARLAAMRDEIFGPILPIVPYDRLEDAIAFVEARPRPLALYVFARDRGETERVLDGTTAGGVTVNDVILHIAQDDLPFGGVGPSGMGRYHGREGFETFSNRKAVFRQPRLNGMGLFRPPYGRRFEALVRLLLR